MQLRAWVIIAAALLTVFSGSAEARHRHHHYRHAHHYARHHHAQVHHRRIHYDSVRGDTRIVGGRPSGCPHAYCGCEASRYLFGRIIADLNLAANWFRFPRASPAPGMAAVRQHHVFVILSVNGDGTVMAHDGNSGHGLTREHVVSLRGYTVVDPHGRKYASN